MSYSSSLSALRKTELSVAIATQDWTDTNFAKISSLASVATTGSYNDLSDVPTIPEANDGRLTIQRNGTEITSFTANQSADISANIEVPLSISQLTNDTGFVTQDVRQILPISVFADTSVSLNTETYVYQISDDQTTGAFPTIVAPAGIAVEYPYYFVFEIEWTTAASLASYSVTYDWINYPEIYTDGLAHTYYIAGRYSSQTSAFTLNCWRSK